MNGSEAPTRTIEHQMRARDERDFFLNRACAGFTIEGICQRSRIDRWFLTQIKENVDFEEALAATKG